MASKIKNTSQQRARFAYQQVEQVNAWEGKESDTAKKEFKSHVKDIPMMIRTNGLAATYAFVFSKRSKKDYAAILSLTEEWLVKNKGLFATDEKKEFYQNLIELDQYRYRMAAREVMSLFTWLKRYADGLLEKPDKNNQSKDNG